MAFRTDLAKTIFINKYALTPEQTWEQKCDDIVKDVTNNLMPKEDQEELRKILYGFKALPGGRYIYYAGRPAAFYNNCFLLKGEEDTREEWGNVLKRASDCLMSGGGIGVDYSVFRPNGATLNRTGGKASGPIPLMYSVNEVGRNVMQGGSRRSAIYASLNWRHGDAEEFLRIKDWANIPAGPDTTFKDLKEWNFNAHAPLDMTNISLNYDNQFLDHIQSGHLPPLFVENCRKAMQNGEPGFSFNFGDKENETLRNAPVSANTRVLTKGGYVAIGDIVGVPTEVWTGKQWAITTFKRTGEADTLRVLLSNGRYIDADPSHPFMQWTKKGLVRVAAKDLKEGMSIACELPTDVTFGGPEQDYGYGFVFGDGSIFNYRGELSYHVSSKEEPFKYACSVLGAKTVSKPNRAYFKSQSSSKELLGTPGFVAGWFDADGNDTRGMLRLSHKDRGNLVWLSELLDLWGIKTTIREEHPSGYGSVTYTLLVTKDSQDRFAEVIPTRRLKPSGGAYRKHNMKVKAVVPTGVTEDVYCCDVGVEEHSFMAEGVLISNCTEVTSEDDSDVCNLASINMAKIDTLEDFRTVVRIMSQFLVCGTITADLPYAKVYEVRKKNRRLGLGLMGIHEWLLKRGYGYEVNGELRQWLEVYREESERAANELCDKLSINRPVAYRSIAPTGTIGILAGTTTGIEPLFAVAYKRRYLVGGSVWKYQYVVDAMAKQMIDEYGLKADSIETAASMAQDFEKRMKFQAGVQDYVDMSISSTINLPEWGSELNNEDRVMDFANTLAKYASRLRGFTAYPDGARGGQPLTVVPYEEAMGNEGLEFEENSDQSCANGVCGI